jgi:hypothetical protein
MTGLAARKACEDNFSVAATSFGWIAETCAHPDSRRYYYEVTREMMMRVEMLALMRQIGVVSRLI